MNGDEPYYRAATGGLLLLMMAIGGYHRRRAARLGGPVSRRDEPPHILIPLRACGVAALVLVLVYLARPQWLAWAAVPLPPWLRWLGAALAGAAIVLVLWVFRTLGHNLTDTVATRPNHTLVTGGPYRWVRHPFYVTGLLLSAGLFLLTALWVLPALTAVAFTFLALRTPIEEAKLIERFGDQYRDYARRTGRFLPRLRLGAGK